MSYFFVLFKLNIYIILQHQYIVFAKYVLYNNICRKDLQIFVNLINTSHLSDEFTAVLIIISAFERLLFHFFVIVIVISFVLSLYGNALIKYHRKNCQIS